MLHTVLPSTGSARMHLRRLEEVKRMWIFNRSHAQTFNAGTGAAPSQTPGPSPHIKVDNDTVVVVQSVQNCISDYTKRNLAVLQYLYDMLQHIPHDDQ